MKDMKMPEFVAAYFAIVLGVCALAVALIVSKHAIIGLAILGCLALFFFALMIADSRQETHERTRPAHPD